MKLKEFLKSKIRLKILDYLNNHDEVFIYRLSKELDCTWKSSHNQLKKLLDLGLIQVNKEEKARGKGRRRKAYSITKKGIKLFKFLREVPLILKKVSLLLKED